MDIPYFVYTSGEDGESGLDWGVKFTSPSLSSSPDTKKRNTEIDKAYRRICDAFSCPLDLERPKDNGLLVLPWSESEVLLGYVFPYTDLSDRPNISLVGAIVSPPLSSSPFSNLLVFVRELHSQNLLEMIAKRGWGKDGSGERPGFLSLEEGKNHSSADSENLALPQDISWPERNRGFMVINGKKQDLYRKEEKIRENIKITSAPTVPSLQKREIFRHWFAGGALLFVIVAGCLFWYKQSRDAAKEAERFIASPPFSMVTPVPVPDRSEEVAHDIVDALQRARDPNRQHPDSLEHFISLGYAHAYDDISYKLKGIANMFIQSPFESADITLETYNFDDNVIILKKNTIKQYILEALKKLVNVGEFGALSTINAFYVKNVLESSYVDFKKNISDVSLIRFQNGTVISRGKLVEDIVFVIDKAAKGENINDSFWIICSFKNYQGGFDIYLQEIQKESLKSLGSTLERTYIPPGFMKLSKNKADKFLEERFSQKKEYPYVSETGELEFQFRLSISPTVNQHQEICLAYLEQFAWEMAEGIVQASRVD